MAAHTTLDQISTRVDRLVLRHQELQRVNLLLQQHLNAMRQERDQLHQQCALACQRIDLLLAQLPPDQEAHQA